LLENQGARCHDDFFDFGQVEGSFGAGSDLWGERGVSEVVVAVEVAQG
jgi:hypothetical protein